jgi:gliding motility-associated-like protein
VEISANANILSPLEYEWVVNGNTILEGNNENQLIINQQSSGTLYVNFDSLCFAQVDFNVISDFSTLEAWAGNDTVLSCYYPQVTLQGSTNSTSAVVNWLYNNNPIFGANALNHTTSLAGIYQLVVLNPANGCISADTLLVNSDFSVPQVVVGMQDTLNCLLPSFAMQGVMVNAMHNYQAQWTTTGGNIVNGANTLSPTINLPGWYAVVITDLINGCVDSTAVYVEENTDLDIDPSLIQFPNVFSPNNDEKNARWHPFLINEPARDIAFFFTNFELVVYNRWGNKVFETNKAQSDWAGDEHEEGVYFYHVVYSTLCGNGEKVMREGNIHLLR